MRAPIGNTPGSISKQIKSAHSLVFPRLHVLLIFFVIFTLLTAFGFASSSQEATALAKARTTSPLIFNIRSTPILPNPAILPPSTYATLHSLGTFRSAPLLSRSNAFAFAGLTPGSYSFRVHARDYAFEVLRVDIGVDVGVAGEDGTKGVDGAEGAGTKKGKLEVEGGLKVQAWQTFPGHAWDNKGEPRGEGWIGVSGSDKGVGKYSEDDGGDGTWRVSASDVNARIAAGGGDGNSNGTGDRAGAIVIEVRPVSVLNYYQARSEFSVFSVFKNPMILLALVSLGLVVGVPYLIDNMDPETKADFQKMQAESRSSLPSQSAAASQLKDFDVASWLAGRPSASATGASASTGSSNGSDKKKK